MTIAMNGKKENSMRFNLYHLLSILSLFLFASCSSPEIEKEKEYLQLVDFSEYQDQMMNARSRAENARIDSLIFDRIETASIGKYLQPFYGMDEYGKSMRIDTLVDAQTLLTITSPYSNWNSIDIAKDLPSILEGLEKNPKIINLILKEPNPSGQAMPDNFYKIQIEQLRLLYPHTYMINGSEARKLNMYALPCRYYLDKEGKILKISKGAIPINRVKKEVKSVFSDN